MEFTDTIKNRYSCKKYSDRAVEQDRLEAILEAGRVAPTAKNLQEQHIYVLQSKEALEKLDGLTPCRYGAPTVLLVAFDSSNVYTYPGSERTSGVEDASIVATHMILAAAAEGVDSCWVNRLNPEEAARVFGLPIWAMQPRARTRFPTTARARRSPRPSRGSRESRLLTPASSM